MSTSDDRLADVLFLAAHPTWTWRDLEDTPEDVVGLVRVLDRMTARAREEAAK